MHGPVVVCRGCSSQYPDDIGVLVWVRGTVVAGLQRGFWSGTGGGLRLRRVLIAEYIVNI